MKHDHRSSLWIIAGGAIIWCYQCGVHFVRDHVRLMAERRLVAVTNKQCQQRLAVHVYSRDFA